jgi:hypothetical protein
MPAVEPLPFTFAKNAACAVYGTIRFMDEGREARTKSEGAARSLGENESATLRHPKRL